MEKIKKLNILCIFFLISYLPIVNAQNLRDLGLKKLVVDGNISPQFSNYLISQWSEFPNAFSTYLKEFCFYYGRELRNDYRGYRLVPVYREPKLSKEQIEGLYPLCHSMVNNLGWDESATWEVIISFLPFLERSLESDTSLERAVNLVGDYLKKVDFKNAPSLIFKIGVCASFGFLPEDASPSQYALIYEGLMNDTGPIIKSLVLDYGFNFTQAKGLVDKYIYANKNLFDKSNKDYSFIQASWKIWLSEAIFKEKLSISKIEKMYQEFKLRNIYYPSRFSSKQWEYIFEGKGGDKVLGIVANRRDHNGATLDLRDYVDEFIKQGYKIYYFEAGTIFDFMKALNGLVIKGGADVLFLTGHGRPYRVGEYLNFNDLSAMKIFQQALNDGLRKAIKPRGGIIILGCTVGSHKDMDETVYEENVPDRLYEDFPQVSFIYAPEDLVTGINEIKFDSQGNVITVEYSSGPFYNPVIPGFILKDQ